MRYFRYASKPHKLSKTLAQLTKEKSMNETLQYLSHSYGKLIFSIIWISISVFISYKCTIKLQELIPSLKENLRIGLSIIVFIAVLTILCLPASPQFLTIIFLGIPFLGLAMLLDTWKDIKNTKDKS